MMSTSNSQQSIPGYKPHDLFQKKIIRSKNDCLTQEIKWTIDGASLQKMKYMKNGEFISKVSNDGQWCIVCESFKRDIYSYSDIKIYLKLMETSSLNSPIKYIISCPQLNVNHTERQHFNSSNRVGQWTSTDNPSRTCLHKFRGKTLRINVQILMFHTTHILEISDTSIDLNQFHNPTNTNDKALTKTIAFAYIRLINHSTKLFANIPKDICSLCCQFIGQHRFIQNNAKVKCIINGHDFTQRILHSKQNIFFEACNILWTVHMLCQNGIFHCELQAMLKDEWTNVTAFISVGCTQLHSYRTSPALRNFSSNESWTALILPMAEIENVYSEWKQITFQISVEILQINLKHNKIGYDAQLMHFREKETMKWEVSESVITKMVRSGNGANGEVFSNVKECNGLWYLSCFPNGINDKIKGDLVLSLNIFGMPTNVSKLTVQYRLYCPEAKISYVNTDDFFNLNENEQNMGCSWPWSTFCTLDLKKYSTLTFCAEVAILRKYDLNGNCTCIQSKCDWSDTALIRNDINEMKTNIAKLESLLVTLMGTKSDQKSGVNAQSERMFDEKQRNSALYRWLKETVNMEQYFGIFAENGFEDFETVKEITMDELKDIGIAKLGHRKKIDKYLRKLV